MHVLSLLLSSPPTQKKTPTQTQSKDSWGYCMRSCTQEEEETPDDLEVVTDKHFTALPPNSSLTPV